MEEIKVVKFYPFEVPYRNYKLVGYADVQIGDLLIIKSVKLMRNRYGGLYVQMPDIYKDNRSYPIVEVLSKELLEGIRRKVVDYYNSLF